MRELSTPSWFQWDRPWPGILFLAFGVGMVILMYMYGGLAATFPFNLVGVLGFFLIGYASIRGGITDLRSMADTAARLPRMIRSAKKSIRIFTGELAPVVYLSSERDGGETPIKLLLKKAEVGVEVDIITEWKPADEAVEGIRNDSQNMDKEKIKKHFRLSRLPLEPKSIQEHFIVVDDMWVRVEGEHSRGERNQRINRIVRHSLYLHAILNRQFNVLSRRAKKVPLFNSQ